jgi:putative spermidine/putrescine transport system substrate-binding protein
MDVRVRLGLAALISVSLLAGCADSPQDTVGAPGGGDGKNLVMIGYGGDLATPYQEFLIEPFEAAHDGVSIKQVPSESGDFVAQIKAAKGNSPYDVVPLGESRLVTAINDGWVARLDDKELPNLADVQPVFDGACRGYGAPVTYSLIGLAYNPDKVPAPSSWADLWDNPAYKGKIGLVSSASNLGFAFFVQAAKLAGGGESNLDPGFGKVAQLKPFVVAPNPTSLAQLFERGEIAIAPLWNNDAAVLKSKGLPVEFVRPAPGAIADVTCMTVVNNTANSELATELVNNAVGPEYQRQAAQKPWYFGPVNQKVEVPQSEYLLSDPKEFDALVRVDWDAAAPKRSQITERFNQEFGS